MARFYEGPDPQESEESPATFELLESIQSWFESEDPEYATRHDQLLRLMDQPYLSGDPGSAHHRDIELADAFIAIGGREPGVSASRHAVSRYLRESTHTEVEASSAARAFSWRTVLFTAGAIGAATAVGLVLFVIGIIDQHVSPNPYIALAITVFGVGLFATLDRALRDSGWEIGRQGDNSFSRDRSRHSR